MAKKQMGLGRGLDELFGSAEPEVTLAPSELDINLIEPSREQPRKSFPEEALNELSESIALHGVISPITVRKISDDRYRIIAGERRYRASRMAGLKTVPVHIVEADELSAMEMGLVENIQRQDLNPVEEALGYRSLMDEYGMTQEETAGRVGKSRPAVANALRLLALTPKVLDMVRTGKLSAGHARAVLSLKTEKAQEDAAQKIAALGLSVRQAELLCKNMTRQPAPEPKVSLAVDYVAECEKSLSKHLGRGVKIINGKRKGKFELEFYGQEDLQNLLDALMTLKK